MAGFMESLRKIQVHEACLNHINRRYEELQQALKAFQNAANEETKSSAGDKYETGRAMMHLEKEKVAAQMDQTMKQLQAIRQLNPEKPSEKIAHGSMIQTDQGVFYLSVSLGKLEIAGTSVFCLSPVAPLGKMFLAKGEGDVVSFGGRHYQILSVT